MLAAACWPEDLIHDLRWIDAQASSPERLFTVATVKVGPHTGLRAVGIAANQKRLKSASNVTPTFLCHFSMHVLFFLACGSSCQRLLRDRAKHQVDLRSNHSNTFSTIEGHHHVVSLPMQRTDERKQDESEALRCSPFRVQQSPNVCSFNELHQ